MLGKPIVTVADTPIYVGPVSLNSSITSYGADSVPLQSLKEAMDAWRLKHRLRRSRSLRPIYRPIPLVAWKRLALVERLKRCLQVIPVDASADFTLGVDRVLLAKAMRHKRGPVDYFYRRLSRHLESTFNQPIDFFVVGELDPLGTLHLHGVFGLGEVNFKLARSACRKACGSWDHSSRQFQFKIRPHPDFGWLGYILKDCSLEGRSVSISRFLNLKARRHHNSRLVAKMVRKHQS